MSSYPKNLNKRRRRRAILQRSQSLEIVSEYLSERSERRKRYELYNFFAIDYAKNRNEKSQGGGKIGVMHTYAQQNPCFVFITKCFFCFLFSLCEEVDLTRFAVPYPYQNYLIPLPKLSFWKKYPYQNYLLSLPILTRKQAYDILSLKEGEYYA